jgi:hypothetical protein
MASRVLQTSPEQVIKEVFQVFDEDEKGKKSNTGII